MKESIVDRIVEVFWIAVKAAVVTAVILILLQIIPINIQHTGSVDVDGNLSVSQPPASPWSLIQN